MTANKTALISKAVLEIEVNAVIYRHTYIRILVFWVRGMYFVERSIHLIEEHLHTAGFGHRQPRLARLIIDLELTYLRYLLYPR